jgi:DNA-binding transcriptional LysR family regulator
MQTLADPAKEGSMDWDDLRIFLAVARTESLSGAGRRLKIDPATVGRRISRLEEAMGARLFAKGPQGYTLTEEGGTAAVPCRTAEAAMAAAADALSWARRADRPDPHRRAGWLRQLSAAAGSGARSATTIRGWRCRLSRLPRVFNLSKREADMAISVSAPTAGRLSVQKLTDYTCILRHRPTIWPAPAPILTRADLRKAGVSSAISPT